MSGLRPHSYDHDLMEPMGEYPEPGNRDVMVLHPSFLHCPDLLLLAVHLWHAAGG